MDIQIIDSLPEDLLITGHAESRIVVVDGRQLMPDQSQKVRNHSPDGFAWGYGGSGPAQLALAILLIYLPQEDAVSIYQTFKFNEVAKWPKENFAVRINLKEAVKHITGFKDVRS